jgi:hypothetical protein
MIPSGFPGYGQLDLPKPAKVKTPLLVLGVARDNMIAPREIEATGRAYNTRAEIIPNVAHNSMLERNWQVVAERILVWLKEQKSKPAMRNSRRSLDREPRHAVDGCGISPNST